MTQLTVGNGPLDRFPHNHGPPELETARSSSAGQTSSLVRKRSRVRIPTWASAPTSEFNCSSSAPLGGPEPVKSPWELIRRLEGRHRSAIWSNLERQGPAKGGSRSPPPAGTPSLGCRRALTTLVPSAAKWLLRTLFLFPPMLLISHGMSIDRPIALPRAAPRRDGRSCDGTAAGLPTHADAAPAARSGNARRGPREAFECKVTFLT
jgi:hypothetical protein